MCLLLTISVQLDEFQGNDIPKYVILPHVWGEGEVLFQDLAIDDSEKLKEKKGFGKLVASCAIASQKGWNIVSTRRAAQSSQRRSTLCFRGTVTPKSAMHILQMYPVPRIPRLPYRLSL